MANKLFVKLKEAREIKYTSISKHNALCGSEYILFDPPNITSFECAKGEVDGRIVYIREKLACMWGNEDIEEYVVIDAAARQAFEDVKPKDIIKARVGDTVVEYTQKRGRFMRRHYNVWFERGGAYYYLYIRTSDGGKFKTLMEDFIEKAKI